MFTIGTTPDTYPTTNSKVFSVLALGQMLFHSISTGEYSRKYRWTYLCLYYPSVIGWNCISEKRTAHMFWAVSVSHLSRAFCLLTAKHPDNEFSQLMKGLQGERLRQAFKYLDADQDGFIRPDEFKRIILVCPPVFWLVVILTCWYQEIAGHKLSDAVIDRLPTLCTLSPGQRISYSEVIAFHNVIRGS